MLKNVTILREYGQYVVRMFWNIQDVEVLGGFLTTSPIFVPLT